MSNANIPQEKLTAYQRWELPCFDANAPRKPGDLILPTAREIEAIQRQSHDEGYQAGYAEGKHKAQQEAQRLSELANVLEQQVDEQVAQALLDLALELAKQMLHQALKTHPELVLNVVREAVESLPHFNQSAHVVLHPSDAALVREHMGEQLAHAGWKIFEDDKISRGGARVATSNSQIDATLETRWKRVVATIGQDSSWLLQ
jgi:flagellar assembly protein FliH